jgi:hypothetical protein
MNPNSLILKNVNSVNEILAACHQLEDSIGKIMRGFVESDHSSDTENNGEEII